MAEITEFGFGVLAWNRTMDKFVVVRIWFSDVSGHTLMPASVRHRGHYEFG